MKIQQRDIEILKCCYEQQFLTLEQIEKYYFKSTHGNLARRRVGELRKAGLVRAEDSRLATTGKIIRLTRSGQKLIASQCAFDVPQARSIDLATLMHDSIVTSVRLRLSEIWSGAWVPERALKDKYPIIPDGIVKFESGFNVAVEIENSSKGRTRFCQILNTWNQVENVSLILYIATTEQLERLILSYLAEVKMKLPAVVVQWSSLCSGMPLVKSPAGELPIFSKREL